MWLGREPITRRDMVRGWIRSWIRPHPKNFNLLGTFTRRCGSFPPDIAIPFIALSGNPHRILYVLVGNVDAVACSPWSSAEEKAAERRDLIATDTTPRSAMIRSLHFPGAAFNPSLSFRSLYLLLADLRKLQPGRYMLSKARNQDIIHVHKAISDSEAQDLLQKQAATVTANSSSAPSVPSASDTPKLWDLHAVIATQEQPESISVMLVCSLVLTRFVVFACMASSKSCWVLSILIPSQYLCRVNRRWGDVSFVLNGGR